MAKQLSCRISTLSEVRQWTRRDMCPSVVLCECRIGTVEVFIDSCWIAILAPPYLDDFWLQTLQLGRPNLL